MSTMLADSPAAASGEQPPTPEAPGDSPEPAAGASAQPKCRNCGGSMEPGQDWCLHCGAGARGSLATRSSGWRLTATMIAATLLLVVAAATAAYAALTKTNGVRHVVVVRAPAPVAAAPSTPVAPPKTPATTAKPPATPATPATPAVTVKPPKIPLATATPKSTGTTPKSPAAAVPPAATTPKTTTTTEQPTPITIDTNAVSTYNPDGYPASIFGDPTLAVDGDTSTGWIAQVDPAIVPRMAAGLLIDLKAAQRLSSLVLVTSTPGISVQVFAANATTAPATITDPGWTKLSPSELVRQRHTLINLRDSTKAFRFVTLWISHVPAGSIGTPQAPGHVSVNEVELFPAK